MLILSGYRIFLRINLPKIKNPGSIINLDEFKPIGTHVYGNNMIHFASLGVKNIPKKLKIYIKQTYHNKYL